MVSMWSYVLRRSCFAAGAWLDFNLYTQSLVLGYGRAALGFRVLGPHLGCDPALHVLQDPIATSLGKVLCCKQPCQRRALAAEGRRQFLIRRRPSE